MRARRVVTGHAGGKSVVISDGQTRKTRDYVNVPGMSSALLWSTPALPSVPHDGTDPISENSLYVPPLGETRLMLVTFPPDSVTMSDGSIRWPPDRSTWSIIGARRKSYEGTVE